MSGIEIFSPPAVFYSDLENGPNTGGENNAGAYVTIYGKRFGSERASSFVTIGAGRATAYPIWTDTKVTFQLGPRATSGSIVVHTAAGESPSIPFAVRSGNIYFVSATGSDTGRGSVGSPWRTLIKARNSIGPGDIVYALNGVSQTAEDGEGWGAAMTLRGNWCGSTGYPRALVAYPGANVTIGSNQGSTYGLRTTDFTSNGCAGGWIFAGLNFRGRIPALLAYGDGYRIIGNDFSCPESGVDGGGSCFGTMMATHVNLYGNIVHGAGAPRASALFQAVYIGTDSNYADIGWNVISNVNGCRGLQVHSSPLGSAAPKSGQNMFGISIHDNLIHDTQCDGIVIDTVDPSKGEIAVYNNVIYNAGKGPANPENTGNWSCIYVPGTTENGSAGSGLVKIYNNTLVNCGAFRNPPWANATNGVQNGMHNPKLIIDLRNNIIFQPAGAGAYLGSSGRGIVGAANLFFGSGVSSYGDVKNSIFADPLFKNIAQNDFHLTERSPARQHSLKTEHPLDHDGNPRNEPNIGAFQFTGQQGSF